MNFHYYSDGAALLACTAALWFLPLRGERDAHLTSPAARELLSRSRSTPGRIGAIALTGVLALGCLVSAQSYEGFWRDNPGRTFTDNYLRALRERPDTELFDGPPPVAFGFIFPPPPYVTRSQEFVVFPLQPRWVTHTSELFVLQQDGRIVPGVVRGIDVPVTSSVPCGTLVQGTTSIPVPGSPMRWSRTIYLDYLSKKASAVTLRFGDWSATVPVSAGLGRLYVATDGGGPSLQVTTEGIGDSLCIGRLVIGDQVPG